MAAAVASYGKNGFTGSHDAAVDEFRQDLGLDANGPTEQNIRQYDTNAVPARDVDEEVQIKKKRKPVAKLDEARLLSNDGIPRLRRIAKSSKVKFKGKGHEFSDIGNLLSTYQFWLDDLYPKAKFRDALTMVEKLGHSRRMQIMRRQWIDDSKPRGREPTPEETVEDAQAVSAGERENISGQDQPGESREDAVMGNTGSGGLNDDMPDDDDLDALLAEHESGNEIRQVPPPRRRTGPFDDESEDEDGPDADELDALLAEHRQPVRKAPTTASVACRRLPFDEEDEDEPDQDELDALLAEHDHMKNKTAPATQSFTPVAQSNEEDGPDQDELDALMNEQDQATPRPNPEQLNITSSQPLSVGEDELDALMDEHEASKL